MRRREGGKKSEHGRGEGKGKEGDARDEERTDGLGVDADHLDGVYIGFERSVAKEKEGKGSEGQLGRETTRRRVEKREDRTLTSSRSPSCRTTD